MIRELLTFVYCIALLFSSSCNNNVKKDPEKIGNEAFEIVHNISTDTQSDFLNYFISLEEYRELGKNESLITDEQERNQLTSLTKEEYEKHHYGMYNNIKENGAEYGIEWKEITYLDFVYEIENKNGLKKGLGKLYFKYGSDSYRIKVYFVFDGKEYRISKIKGPIKND
jgi:hypothetical protein